MDAEKIVRSSCAEKTENLLITMCLCVCVCLHVCTYTPKDSFDLHHLSVCFKIFLSPLTRHFSEVPHFQLVFLLSSFLSFFLSFLNP